MTALVASGLGAAVASASATASWRIASSPKPFGPLRQGLGEVGCASTTSCFVVGNPAGVEYWNGTIWSLESTPNLGSTSVLEYVACPSTTSCYAVGEYSTDAATKTLLEHWNGTAWSIVGHPEPAGDSATLSGVACASTTSCVAVGEYQTSTGATKTLAERWNGTTWALVFSANPAGSTAAALDGVSCTSPTSCYATGASTTGSDTTALIEHWNGTNLLIVSSPNPDGTTEAVLSRVSCASDTSCLAVGSYLTGTSTSAPLAEQWDGTSWSIGTVATPVDATSTDLGDVSCFSTTSCFAVGTYVHGSAHDTLAEHWNGSSWSVVATPNPAVYQRAGLSGVSCPGATTCFAVGHGDEALTERWNGTRWAIAAAPSGSSESKLMQVACPSTTRCFAVGEYDNGALTQPLVEQWNGTSWSILASPNPSGENNSMLRGVACTSPTNCLAVGLSSHQVGTSEPLVEHWNGTAWSVVASPDPSGATLADLLSVACPTATSCYAVGEADSSDSDQMLVEHWNGTGMSILPSPNPSGALDSDLAGVSCPTATSCFAVGSQSTNTAIATLIERWNGIAWSIISSPNPTGSASAYLQGVSCVAVNSCEAVGSNFTNALVERWNGTAWSIVASANPSNGVRLLSVSCTSTSACFAVGSQSPAQTLVERLNGTSWTIMTSPNPAGARNTILSGLACPSSTNCYAVGDSSTSSSDGVLIERYG